MRVRNSVAGVVGSDSRGDEEFGLAVKVGQLDLVVDGAELMVTRA